MAPATARPLQMHSALKGSEIAEVAQVLLDDLLFL